MGIGVYWFNTYHHEMSQSEPLNIIKDMEGESLAIAIHISVLSTVQHSLGVGTDRRTLDRMV